jgi:hypothetical protein
MDRACYQALNEKERFRFHLLSGNILMTASAAADRICCPIRNPQ